MFGSFQIASIAGIPIRVHVLFVVLVAGLALVPDAGFLQLAILAMLVVSVVLHELGHALVARRFGIRVVDITLWPLGGLARLSSIPESSGVEAAIAIAGPLVNLFLALAAAPVVVAGFFLGAREAWVGEAAFAFVAVNVLMAGFNLLPAFPTDGGRLVRAWFARSRSWLDATVLAVRVGRAMALLLAVTGVVWGQWMLPVVALWLWWTGGLELTQVRARAAAARLEGLGARAPDPAVRA
ncbi:MAG: site-2 protease family protein [Planctomycetes bacterium]|nr:site-2 protease family protein [Planctomycetota bacterium]